MPCFRNMSMRCLCSAAGVALIALALLILLPPPMAAADRNLNPTLLPPGATPYGQTYGEWSADWWVWASSASVEEHPLLEGDCSWGQSGPVWFLGGTFTGEPTTRTCTIPPGKAIFFPIVTTTYWYPEDAQTEAELRAIVNEIIDGAEYVSCTIDGVPVQDIGAFRADSPAYVMPVPEDGITCQWWGYEPGDRDPAVADGIYIMLAPLPRGEHTIEFHGELYGGWFVQDVTYHLTVGH